MSLDKIKIQRSKLLDTVRANRAKHEEDYNKGLALWKADFCEAALKLVKDTLEESWSWETKSFKKVWDERPTNRLKDYDKVITMLEFSADDLIELNSGEFDCYVLNSWHDQWRASNSPKYSTFN